MQKTSKVEVDYFCIPKVLWKEMLARIELEPIVRKRNLPPSAVQDIARRAVLAGKVRTGGATSDYELSIFDASDWVDELTGDPTAAHLTTPERGQTPKSNEQRHPALGPNDPVPRTPAWDAMPAERKLRLSNAMIAFDIEQAKKNTA